MDVQHFYDKETSTLTYIVYDPTTKDAVIIDPVLNFDPDTGVIAGESLKEVIEFVRVHALNPLYALETHAHADHISSSQQLKNYFPKIKIGISKNIVKVQTAFNSVFRFDETFKTDGSQFDKLIEDNEIFTAGSINIHAIPTPGHTPACMSFHIENLLFCGDALFYPDSGTGRCDFPGGSADELYTSVHEVLYKLPENTITFTGHDYRPNGRELKFESTIGAAKRENSHLKEGTTRLEYVNFREARDKTLPVPKLLMASIQVNINGGILPDYLKMPLVNNVQKI